MNPLLCTAILDSVERIKYSDNPFNRYVIYTFYFISTVFLVARISGTSMRSKEFLLLCMQETTCRLWGKKNHLTSTVCFVT